MKDNKSILAIVQARMGSTRLPGKVMMPIEGHPMLWHVVNRLKRCGLLNGIIVATSGTKADDDIEKFCGKNGFVLFRGSEEDVLGRYYEAAREHKADVVVRITADCPLIDPKIVDKVISAYLKGQRDAAGASNVLKRTYPRGLDTEVFSFKCLKACNDDAVDPREREHVTLFIYRNPARFSMLSVENDKDLSGLRWTVDEEPDLEFVRETYKRLYKDNGVFFMEDVISLLKNEPRLIKINKQIRQKTVK